jgi:hypothetical protein
LSWQKKTFGIIGPAWLHPAIFKRTVSTRHASTFCNFTTSVSALRRPNFLPIGSFLEAA